MSLSSDELEALLASPALAPPEGVTPNFDNPPNQNDLAWAVTTACMVIATLCLFLRCYARLWIEKKVRIEEAYWGTAYAADGMIWTPGYYVHTWNLRNKDLIQPLYLILVYGCCYSAVLPLIKTAILLDWCRIFTAGDKRKSVFWWCCMGVVGFQCLWGILCIILLNIQCTPHNAIWEFYLPSKCFALPKVMLTSASVQVATDIVMVLLPQRIIWGLQMNLQRKIGISIIFGVGILASIAACFRLDHTIAFAQAADTMYFIGPLLFWACAEMTCGFFILSVPCLPKIIRESGLPRKMKSALGISVKTTNPSDQKSSDYATGSTPQRSKSGLHADSYYKMRDDGVSMTNFDRSESQEQLHGGPSGQDSTRDGKLGVQVTRTTQITVTSGSRSGSDTDENMTPWAK
ncbi:60s ribosomal protein l36 [Colletotrichum chrysophilum]|uniref:60s ribosomal protein l36 n=1 Tax=Colletotrichum chrysophilum TaxID=1836956 RepID=A0AAD9AWC9_9PEZI|nr:60s ribosomal protein l36 [Colletotrichum chrysophilum]